MRASGPDDLTHYMEACARLRDEREEACDVLERLCATWVRPAAKDWLTESEREIFIDAQRMLVKAGRVEGIP